MVAHSFIFGITAMPRPVHILRTLAQKTGGTPLGPANSSRLSRERHSSEWRRCPPASPSLVAGHRRLAALNDPFYYLSYEETGGRGCWLYCSQHPNPPASEGGRYKSAGRSACSTQQALPQSPACPKRNRRVHSPLLLYPLLCFPLLSSATILGLPSCPGGPR
jgi:hypothetical protein